MARLNQPEVAPVILSTDTLADAQSSLNTHPLNSLLQKARAIWNFLSDDKA